MIESPDYSLDLPEQYSGNNLEARNKFSLTKPLLMFILPLTLHKEHKVGQCKLCKSIIHNNPKIAAYMKLGIRSNSMWNLCIATVLKTAWHLVCKKVSRKGQRLEKWIVEQRRYWRCSRRPSGI